MGSLFDQSIVVRALYDATWAENLFRDSAHWKLVPASDADSFCSKLIAEIPRYPPHRETFEMALQFLSCTPYYYPRGKRPASKMVTELEACCSHLTGQRLHRVRELIGYFQAAPNEVVLREKRARRRKRVWAIAAIMMTIAAIAIPLIYRDLESSLLVRAASGSSYERMDAIRRLGVKRSMNSVPVLIDALADDVFVDAASRALVRICDVRGLGAVFQNFGRTNSESAKALLEELPGCGESATYAIQAFLHDSNSSQTGKTLISRLSGFGESGPKALVAIVTDRKLEVGLRASAIEALAAVPSSVSASALIGVIKTELGAEHDDLRKTAWKGLGQQGNHAIGFLSEAIGDPSTTHFAAEALGQRQFDGIGGRIAKRHLNSTEPSVRAAALSVLILSSDASESSAAYSVIQTSSCKVRLGAFPAMLRHGTDLASKTLNGTLSRCGTYEMAVELLNCGEPSLERAAKRWAASNGYTVETRYYFGESRPRSWGNRD